MDLQHKHMPRIVHVHINCLSIVHVSHAISISLYRVYRKVSWNGALGTLSAMLPLTPPTSEEGKSFIAQE